MSLGRFLTNTFDVLAPGTPTVDDAGQVSASFATSSAGNRGLLFSTTETKRDATGVLRLVELTKLLAPEGVAVAPGWRVTAGGVTYKIVDVALARRAATLTLEKI